MKKKLFTLLAALLCGIFVSFAQPEAGTYSITPKVGINMMMLTGDATMTFHITAVSKDGDPDDPNSYFDCGTWGFFTKRSIRVGWRGGVEASYQLSRRFAIAAELEYSYQRTKYGDVDCTFLNIREDFLKRDMRTWTNNTLSQHHIQLPILARYYIHRGLAVEAGLQLEYCMGSKLGTEITADNWDVIITANNASYLTGLNLSIPAGVSYEMKNIVLDARYIIGISNIYKKPQYKWSDKPTSRSNVLEISVGYRLGL